MKILVINCGSSSLKYQLIDMQNEELLAIGLAERIGIDDSFLTHETIGKEKVVIKEDLKDHKITLGIVMNALIHPEYGAIKSMDEISATGHRVVHGGEEFTSSILITDKVISEVERCANLAPLHNPPNLLGIYAAQEILPGVPAVAVFDTAFHQTMPPEAYIYALPYELYEKHGVRRYGFHGTSHMYVARRAAEILEKPIEDLKIITCHIGNGASITAVDGGKSVDTSMGLTPLEGLVMGTRCGDIDPAIVPFVGQREDLSYQEIDNLMNKKSGLLGVSGISNDLRDIMKGAEEGNYRAQLALDLYNRRIKRYIAVYAAMMGGLDVIVFTAGVGENAIDVRKESCSGLEFLGIKIDDEKNNVRGKETVISSDDSKVTVMVVPTNEELAIARDTKEIVEKL
ncbi:MAG: acetate/propionate family kinase [Natronincolaceae bacterium]|jgi:acetate kinase|nr:acetate kinase [Bacillota bacterium]NLK91146.1 acetate kinase [Clostridiales bacterium]